MPIIDQASHTILMFASILAVLSGLRYFQYRTPMARWGGLFLFSLAVEIFCYSFHIVGLEPSTLNYWGVFQFTSFLLLPIFWFLFNAEIAGLTRRMNLPAAIILFSILSLALAGLLLARAMTAETGGPDSFFRLPAIIGAWGSFFIFVYYSMAVLSTGILFRLCAKANAASRRLAVPMLLGTLLLILLSALDHAGFSPFAPYQLAQVGLAAGGVLFFLAAIVWQFGGILPISRESVFEGTHDGVLILDYFDRVVDINTPAQKIIGMKRKDAVGQKLAQVWPLGAQTIAGHPAGRLVEDECEILVDGARYNYEISINQFTGLNDAPTGRLVVLRNVTTRERMEKALHDHAQELQKRNAFLAALAEVILSLHTTTDPSKIATLVGSELTKLGMVCFIAQVDPVTNDLLVKYVSLAHEVIARIEKILGLKLMDIRLDRNQFPELYRVIDLNELSYKTLSPRDLKYGPGKIPNKILEQVLGILGLRPEMKALAMPFVTNTRTLGVLCVWGVNLEERDISSLRIFASQVANVLEKAILYENEIQRSSELARSNSLVMALARVTSAMGSTSNSELVLDLLGSELRKTGLNCAVSTIDEAAGTTYVKYLSFEPDLLKKIEKYTGLTIINFTIPKQTWPDDRVLRERVPAWYPFETRVFRKMFPMLPETIVRKAFSLAGFHEGEYVCILPLNTGTNTIGAMTIWGPDLKPGDHPVLSVFGSQVTGILQNIENYENEVRRKAQLARSNAMVMALSSVASQLDSTSDLEQVFATLGKEMQKVQVNCMVGTLDDARQVMKIDYLSISSELIAWAEKLGITWPGDITIPRHLWPTDKAVMERGPYWDPDPIGSTSKMFPFVPRQIFEKTFELTGMSPSDQVCYLPLTSEEDVFGILAVWGPSLRHEDIPGLSVFANQVATAIKNARLYEQAQKEIVERKQAEVRIQQALNEKEVLLKEVHHRVKNNLQVISSLLSLQAAQAPDPGTRDILRESQNRVRSMALIHEKLYQSSNLARVDFAGYLHNLVNSLSQTYQVNSDRVAIRIQCEKIELDIDTAIPCGLIVNELVSNSLKYAFPDGASGTIEVSCQRTPDQRYRLVVADNGTGLAYGDDLTKGTSLGLKLVTSLTQQIEGEMVVDGKKGARFEIHFAAS